MPGNASSADVGDEGDVAAGLGVTGDHVGFLEVGPGVADEVHGWSLVVANRSDSLSPVASPAVAGMFRPRCFAGVSNPMPFCGRSCGASLQFGDP